MIIRAVAIAGLLAALAAPSMASTPVRLTFRDTTVASGSSLSYPLYVDSSLSGYTVTSYQIEFTYNSSLFKFVGATSSGTLASTWGNPTFSEPTPGTVFLSNAGADTLAGTGRLVVLQFASKLFTGSYNQYGSFSFVTGASTIFNQGFPTTSFRNGTVTLTPGPSISIAPNTALLTIGDSVQFTVSGGKLPYHWSALTPSVAGIDSVSGMMKALTAGTTTVVVRDSSGYVDTSGTVAVRAFRLSFRDTSCYENQTINVPAYCTNLTGLGITAGQFQVVYNQSLWTPVQAVAAGGMLSSYPSPMFSASGGIITISFAGSSALSGSGILLYIQMKASGQYSGGATTGFQNALFNETYPGNSASGNLTVLPLAPVTVSPSGAHTMVVGDSLQFSGTGGVPPYTWSVSGTGGATISSTGWFKPTGSGLDTVKVKDSLGGTGSSGPITIYDFRVNIPDTSLAVSGSMEMPIYVNANSPGILSYELSMTYTTGSYVRADSIDLGGTLSNGMLIAQSFHGDTIAVSAAGVNRFYSSGTLLKVKFAVPDSTPRPTTVYLNFLSTRFNEGVPSGLTKNGSFQIVNGPIFGVSSTTDSLFALVGRSDSTVLTVHNTGIATLTSTIAVIGAASFTVSTSSINVAPGDSAKVTVYFHPISAGPVNATIRFSTNDVNHLQVNFPVYGKTPYPILKFGSTSINFGVVDVGLFKDTTVSISNTGTDTLKISSIVGSPSVFTARPSVATIAPGHSIVDTIRFAPTLGGAVGGRISVTSNSLTSPDTLHSSGAGSTSFPIASYSTKTVAFGNVGVGHYKDTVITISNTGTDTLKISSITASSSVFSGRPQTASIPPGASRHDTLRFTPSATGGFSGRLFIASNAPSSPDTITVSGTGVTPTDVDDPSLHATAYSLEQNFPNPFNPSTNIRFGLKTQSTVRLEVFNILGQKVDDIVRGELSEGSHIFTWNASVPSGVYFYRLEVTSMENPGEHFVQIRKMVLMK